MLTDDEIDKLCPETWSDWKTSARAIEALLLSKLAAAEMPEAIGYWVEIDEKRNNLFASDQLRAYGAACAARMLSKKPKAYEVDVAMGTPYLSYSKVKDALSNTPLYTMETP